MEKCMIKWSQKCKEFTYRCMNLNANTLILPHVSELLNILLTISANKDYNSQAKIVGEAFTDACANTTQFQCIAIKINLDLMLRLFEMCVYN